MSLETNFRDVKSNIRDICERLNKDPEDVKIVAVSKTFSISGILELNQLGQSDFGENRVRELRDKYYNISFQHEVKLNWHMVGHLQSRKVKDIVAFISLIHSVDSFEIAEEIDRCAKKINQTKDILVQINTSGEPQKYGADPDNAGLLCHKISELENVRMKGLMTMAKLTDDKEEIRKCFKLLKHIYDEFSAEFHDFEFLSMGMTNDYHIAIEEGSNMLRIGSAIFGQRTA